MACNATDIPKLDFPRDEIIEVSIFFSACIFPWSPITESTIPSFKLPSSFYSISFVLAQTWQFLSGRRLMTDEQIIPASYNNSAKRIHIPGLPEKIVPASPEDIAIPVPPSGFVTPSPLPSGFATPAIQEASLATASGTTPATGTPIGAGNSIARPRSATVGGEILGKGSQGLAALAASRGRSGTLTPQDGRTTPQPLNIKASHVDPSS